MKSKSLIWLFVLLSVAAGAYYFFTKKKNSEPNTISFAAVLPLTGDVAAYGKDSKDGIDLAIELANKSQAAYKFEVFYEDSKGDPKTAVTALQNILAQHSPIVVIGENISSSTGAMIPVADKAKVILISPSASAPNLSGLSKYFFRVFPSDVEEGGFIAETIANQLPGSKTSVIYVNNDYGVGVKGVFEQKAKEKGLTILSSMGYEKGSKSFKTILTKIKAEKPDAVYIPGYYEDAGLLLKQAKELGITAKFFGSTAEEDPKLIEIAGSAAEGFQYPVSTGYDAASKDSVVTKFIADFKAKYNKEPGLVSALGYDCAKISIDGILKSGNTSENVRNYILNTKNISGAAGLMNFDEKGDVHKPINLKIVVNGKFVNK